MAAESLTRRPIAARSSSWARRVAGTLARNKVHPNTISVLSVFFAALAGACFLWARQWGGGGALVFFILAGLFIQARLLCNLFDGMVAVEGGLGTKTGEIYNELPDRVADALILVCAGYAAEIGTHGPPLGWAAALASVLTAYVRALGGSAGASQQFCGPMAKQQRMFIMTFASLAAGVESLAGWSSRALPLALAVILVGAVITAMRRTRRMAAELEKRC